MMVYGVFLIINVVGIVELWEVMNRKNIVIILVIRDMGILMNLLVKYLMSRIFKIIYDN